MDFREHETDFREADRCYAELKRQHEGGSINDEEFDAQIEQLTAQNAEGRRRAKFGKSEEGHYRDGSTWVRGTPPGYQEGISKPTIDSWSAQAPSPPRTKGVENEKDGR